MSTSDGFSEFSEHALLEFFNDIRPNPLFGFPWGTSLPIFIVSLLNLQNIWRFISKPDKRRNGSRDWLPFLILIFGEQIKDLSPWSHLYYPSSSWLKFRKRSLRLAIVAKAQYVFPVWEYSHKGSDPLCALYCVIATAFVPRLSQMVSLVATSRIGFCLKVCIWR